MPDDQPRAIGLNIVAGRVYVGVVAAPDRLLLDDSCERLDPPQHVAGAEQVVQFSERVRQEIRRITPSVVGVLHPRRYAQWRYADAFTRVSLETAIMFAVHEEGVPLEQLKQDPVAKVLGGRPQVLHDLVRERFDIETPPRYWGDRGPAFAAAYYLAREL